MSKTRKALVLVLSFLCLLSFASFVACNKSSYTEETAKAVAQKTIYSVGDSIDLFSLFETGQGFTYTFNVQKKSSEEKTEIKGRSFYAKEAGDYTVTAVGLKGKVRRSGTAEFTVSETLPFMMVQGNQITMNYKSTINLQMLISNVKMFVASDTAVEYSVDKVEYIKNSYVDSGEVYDLTNGATANGFYDANGKVHFDGEGVYRFHLLATNAGGSADGTFDVTVKENTSTYVDLGDVTFNRATNVATWDAVPDASYYRVKVDFENVITDKTTIDITDYLVPEAGGFQAFDLIVIPLDDNQKELKYEDSEGYDVNGKLVKEDVILAPEGYGDLVLGNYAKVNKDTGMATLTGGKATVSLSSNGISNMDSGYFSWYGDYGLDYFVDFEFTGNNLPNVVFFADNVNGDITFGGSSDDALKNKGLTIMSGVYGVYQTGSYTLAGGDTIGVYGPYRMQSGWSNPNNRWCPDMAKNPYTIPQYIGSSDNYVAPSQYTLLTQDGLKADTSGATYRYTVGTFGSKSGNDTRIYLAIKLYKLNDSATPELLYDISFDTKLNVSDFVEQGQTFKGGNIMVVAPSKEESSTSTFKVSQPYYVEPIDDGEYTLEGGNPGNEGAVNYTSKNDWNSGSRAFDGSDDTGYGLGTYLDIKFTGNNLPMLTFFASETSGGIAEGMKTDVTGAGILLMNGIVHCGGNWYAPGAVKVETNKFKFYGPYKYGAKDSGGNVLSDQNSPKLVCDAGNVNYPKLYRLGQDSLDAETNYRLLIGVIEQSGTICFDMAFINQTDNTLIFEYVVDSSITVAKMKEAMGLETTDVLKGAIIANGALKGRDAQLNKLSTSFTVEFKDEKINLPQGITNEVVPLVPEDGTFTLTGATPDNANAANFTTANADWVTQNKSFTRSDFSGYGLGTYVDVTFTGNNLPNLVFFASESSGAIAEAFKSGVVGAGILLFNGIVYNTGGHWWVDANTAQTGSETRALQIFGPYKYGTNLSGSAYNQANAKLWVIEGNNATYPNLYKLSQDYLNANATTNFRLIVGAIEKSGIIYFDMQFIDVTNSTLIFDYEVNTTITVEQMKTALGLGATDPLKGFIQAHGAYKGREAGTANKLSTTFTIAFSDTKIELPQGLN